MRDDRATQQPDRLTAEERNVSDRPGPAYAPKLFADEEEAKQRDAPGEGDAGKSGTNLMKREYSFQNAPRCTATSKRTRERCKAPAVRGWTVCRFHGARGGAPKGEGNGSYKHGLYTPEAIAERRLLSELLRQFRKTIATIPEQDEK